MSFLDYVLEKPSYGWTDTSGALSVPSSRQLLSEFFSRLNVVKCKKNWLSFFSWFKVAALLPFFLVFMFQFFSWQFFVAGFLYSMVLMGTHGTIWHHRYCTHQAYTFKNKFWRFITRNLSLKIIPEEIYVISHHVHHAKSDQPGDPYNASGGFLYCFLADVNHQPIARTLDEKDYDRVVRLMAHTGVKSNNYQQYQKWGSVAGPLQTILHWVLNWGFWYGAFYMIGGHGLACALFGGAFFWAVGVRTFNYEGHAKGEADKQRDGIDYNRQDNSINQLWPGYVAGEWHNNHHLFPSSARSGFLPYQLDLAWCYIRFLKGIGGVSSYKDSRKQFLERYHTPFVEKKQKEAGQPVEMYTERT